MSTRTLISKCRFAVAAVSIIAALPAMLFTVGACGDGDGQGGAGGGAGGDDGAGGSGGSAQTDAEICDAACTTFILDCGVAYDSTCPQGCLASPVFLSCVKAAGKDCNSLAVCAFEQGCGALAPAGAGSCKASQDCQGTQCIGNPDVSCPCTCASGMSPGNAIHLLRIDQCSVAKCGFPCGTMGNAVDCNTCILSQCATENNLCQAN